MPSWPRTGDKLGLSAFILAILVGFASYLYAAEPGTGTLKIGSSPIDCTVLFQGKTIHKQDAVLTYPGTPTGRYVVLFQKFGATVKKSVVVREGKVTFVFGNLTPKETLKAAGQKAVAEQNSTKKAVPASAPAGSPFPKILRMQETRPDAGVIGKPNEDADLFFEVAEILRKAINPLLKADRYKRAERIYLQIIKRWPESDKVELCHYQLASIYESFFYRNPQKAIEKYKDVLEYNFHTNRNARWRIAILYESQLKDFPKAKEWYELAVKHSANERIRHSAASKIESLTKKGF